MLVVAGVWMYRSLSAEIDARLAVEWTPAPIQLFATEFDISPGMALDRRDFAGWLDELAYTERDRARGAGEFAVEPDAVTLIDDPFRPRGLGSTPFDDEGVAVERRELISAGVINGWLLNTASAAQLGLQTTGHASRGLAGPSGVSGHNLHLEPGERDRAGLMADAKSGLLVTSMFGPSLNANTGDWSAGVSGFWFEEGEIAWPVTEVTVAGNLMQLGGRMVVGSDLEFRGSFNSPSLLIDAVAIAGK